MIYKSISLSKSKEGVKVGNQAQIWELNKDRKKRMRIAGIKPNLNKTAIKRKK